MPMPRGAAPGWHDRLENVGAEEAIFVHNMTAPQGWVGATGGRPPVRRRPGTINDGRERPPMLNS